MSDDKPILQRQAELQSALGPLPVVLVEKFTNWGGTQSSEVLSVQPRNLMEIQRVVVAAKEKGLQIRCLGRGHTWAPLFATDGQICMCMREVDNGEGWRIRLNEPSGQDGEDLTVSVMAGVSSGELAKFFLKHNVCWMSNATLPSVQMGGLIAPACHGGGWDQMSVGDNLKSARIVDCNGNLQTYSDDDPEVMNAVKCSLGLFGVMYDFTVKVKPMKIVENESTFPTIGDIFYKPGELKRLVKENWSVEIFWFPFNSMSWLGTLVAFGEGRVLETGFLPGSWDPKKDQIWLKRINQVEVPKKPAPTPEDYLFEDVGMFVEDAYVRFMTKYLIKWPGSGYPGKKHSLVPGYLKAGNDLVRFANKETKTEKITRAIHYDTWVDLCPTTDLEFCFDTDEDFEDVLKAVKIVIDKCYEKAIKGEFPINLTVEMRWLGTSDAYMCPLRVADKSRGGSGHTFCLDVLAVKGTPKWEEFVCEVSQAWMDMELSGSCARPRPRPHWCKQWSFIPGIDKHIRDAYGEDMEIFKRILERVNPGNKSMYINESLHHLLYPEHHEGTQMPKALTGPAESDDDKTEVDKEMIAWLDSFEPDKKHEKAWKEFCTSLAEHTLNIPNGSRRPNIQSFWKFVEGGLHEGLETGEKSFNFLLRGLAKILFPSLDESDSEPEPEPEPNLQEPDENANPGRKNEHKKGRRHQARNRGKCELM